MRNEPPAVQPPEGPPLPHPTVVTFNWAALFFTVLLAVIVGVVVGLSLYTKLLEASVQHTLTP